MALPFLNELITIGTISGVAIGGFFQIKGYVNRLKEQQQKELKTMIDAADQSIKSHLDKKIELVDTKFQTVDTRIEVARDDIDDVESDMKNMVAEFKTMCDKLSKHDFIIDEIVPEFKSLQKEFNNFRTAVDQQLYHNTIVNSNSNLDNNSDVKQR